MDRRTMMGALGAAFVAPTLVALPDEKLRTKNSVVFLWPDLTGCACGWVANVGGWRFRVDETEFLLEPTTQEHLFGTQSSVGRDVYAILLGTDRTEVLTGVNQVAPNRYSYTRWLHSRQPGFHQCVTDLRRTCTNLIEWLNRSEEGQS